MAASSRVSSSRQHRTRSRTRNIDGPAGQYFNDGQSAEELDAILKEKTSKSKSRNVRQVDTPEEIEELGNELIQRADNTDAWGDYDGRVYEQPGGTQIGIRNKSKSGGLEIDIKWPGGTETKVHLPRGWGK